MAPSLSGTWDTGSRAESCQGAFRGHQRRLAAQQRSQPSRAQSGHSPMALTIPFVRPSRQILLTSKSYRSTFHGLWFLSAIICKCSCLTSQHNPPCTSLALGVGSNALVDHVASLRSGVIHKRSYTEEEANLVLSTLLEIILESNYDKAAQVSCPSPPLPLPHVWCSTDAHGHHM